MKYAKTHAMRTLAKNGIHYDVIPYTYEKEDLDVTKIAEDNHLPLHLIYKTLVCITTDKSIVVAMISGEDTLSTKKLAASYGVKKIALLPSIDLQKYTGYMRGGCSPLAMKNAYPTFIDKKAFEKTDKIYFNAGRKGLLLACKPILLKQVCQAIIADLKQDDTDNF
ncbi:MAG: aminoacyl-tRNA deacylase [Bernardetiaceae bacterium]|nr:aminoacyl-tRNA deacylase [Bernardetiaceae bacterium]